MVVFKLVIYSLGRLCWSKLGGGKEKKKKVCSILFLPQSGRYCLMY